MSVHCSFNLSTIREELYDSVYGDDGRIEPGTSLNLLMSLHCSFNLSTIREELYDSVYGDDGRITSSKSSSRRVLISSSPKSLRFGTFDI
jgi:hypothetical protein